MTTAKNTIVCSLAATLLFGLLTATVSAQAKRVSIADAGAVGDGKTVNTAAIQALIDKTAAGGGGTVVVPAGTFLSGSIFFKQGVNLHLEKDAILKGTNNSADYPQVPTRWEGTERNWTAALVNFFNMTDVRLDGDGMIDGSGTTWPGGGNRGARGATSAPAAQPQAARGPTTAPRGGRPRMIAFQNCKNVTVSGFNMKDQSSWGLFVVYSEDVVIENLTIRAAHSIPSSDGIDIDSSRRVRIAGCDIDCNDDCISIKAGKDADGLRVNRPAEDIVVEKCHFRFGHGGVAMGSETSGGIRNVEVRDCIADEGNLAPVRFKSQPSRGGVVENITYRNMTLNNTSQAFEFNMEWRMVQPIAPPAKVLPVVKNVKVINVSGTVRSGGVIHGLKDSPIQGVSFENCTIEAQRGLRIENAVNVDTSGLKMTVTQGQPITVTGPATAPAN